MKTDKMQVVQRRVDLMAEEGVAFVKNAAVGDNVSCQCLTCTCVAAHVLGCWVWGCASCALADALQLLTSSAGASLASDGRR
jgi:hypothetical protein